MGIYKEELARDLADFTAAGRSNRGPFLVENGAMESLTIV